MIRAKRLGHLVLNVKDMAKSRDFYVDVLGLKVASEKAERGVCFLSLGEKHHDLALFQRAGADASYPDDTQPRMIHFAWQLKDFAEVQAKYKELQAKGYALNTALHNVTQSMYVTDPDGNVCELYCDRWEDGFEAMRTQGPLTRKLDMETGEGVGPDLFAPKPKEPADAK
jgi:catechol 2,3-dioxygenase